MQKHQHHGQIPRTFLQRKKRNKNGFVFVTINRNASNSDKNRSKNRNRSKEWVVKFFGLCDYEKIFWGYYKFCLVNVVIFNYFWSPLSHKSDVLRHFCTLCVLDHRTRHRNYSHLNHNFMNVMHSPLRKGDVVKFLRENILEKKTKFVGVFFMHPKIQQSPRQIIVGYCWVFYYMTRLFTHVEHFC